MIFYCYYGGIDWEKTVDCTAKSCWQFLSQSDSRNCASSFVKMRKKTYTVHTSNRWNRRAFFAKKKKKKKKKPTESRDNCLRTDGDKDRDRAPLPDHVLYLSRHFYVISFFELAENARSYCSKKGANRKRKDVVKGKALFKRASINLAGLCGIVIFPITTKTSSISK